MAFDAWALLAGRGARGRAYCCGVSTTATRVAASTRTSVMSHSVSATVKLLEISRFENAVIAIGIEIGGQLVGKI